MHSHLSNQELADFWMSGDWWGARIANGGGVVVTTASAQRGQGKAQWYKGNVLYVTGKPLGGRKRVVKGAILSDSVAIGFYTIISSELKVIK